MRHRGSCVIDDVGDLAAKVAEAGSRLARVIGRVVDLTDQVADASLGVVGGIDQVADVIREVGNVTVEVSPLGVQAARNGVKGLRRPIGCGKKDGTSAEQGRSMRKLFFGFAIALTACAPADRHAAAGVSTAPTSPTPKATAEAVTPTAKPHDAVVSPSASTDGPFTGVWEECDEQTSPDQCGRYVLIQRGDRICGTWFYVATADAYDGQVEATALSATTARRTRICGRPGSDTQTECSDGWESIDRPLQLCDGKLSESAGGSGACTGRYVRSANPGTQLAELAAEPWAKACLGSEAEGAR